MPPTDDHALLTVRDLAQRLNVSPACVYALVERRQMPHVRIGTGRGIIRFRPEDIEAYLTARRVDPAQQPVRPPRVQLKHIQVRR